MGLTPALPSHDPADLLLSNSELFRELPLEDAAALPSAPDLIDLLGGQEVHPMGFTRVIGLAESSLGYCIADVLAPGSEPPVPVVLTRTEVARMADLLVVGHCPYAEFVSEAMGIDHPGRSVLAAGSVPEEAVPAKFRMPGELATGPGPGPAVVRSPDVHLGPVSFLDREDTHNTMLYNEDEELARRGLSMDDYDDDVIFA
jgi:hypothetical protein